MNDKMIEHDKRMGVPDFEGWKKREKQPTCKHKYLVGKSDGKFICSDCDIILDKLPSNRKLMF